MGDLTVSVDDETYKRARAGAAALDTSLSALVKAYLQPLASAETGNERLKRQEREIRKRIRTFTAASRLAREDAHNRSL